MKLRLRSLYNFGVQVPLERVCMSHSGEWADRPRSECDVPSARGVVVHLERNRGTVPFGAVVVSRTGQGLCPERGRDTNPPLSIRPAVAPNLKDIIG